MLMKNKIQKWNLSRPQLLAWISRQSAWALKHIILYLLGILVYWYFLKLLSRQLINYCTLTQQTWSCPNKILLLYVRYLTYPIQGKIASAMLTATIRGTVPCISTMSPKLEMSQHRRSTWSSRCDMPCRYRRDDLSGSTAQSHRKRCDNHPRTLRRRTCNVDRLTGAWTTRRVVP